MDVTLSMTSGDLDAEDLQNLTNDLCRTVNQETDVTAKLPEEPGEAGTRGDPITVGTLILTFLTSGAAVALFNVVKSYFERNSSLVITFKRKDGDTLEIEAKNVHPDQINRTMEAAREFFGDAA